MDYLWIAVAFVCGFLFKQINLPPLVGYLAAGFGLHALGIEPEDSLRTLANLGVTLLLFTIGLKLNIKSLFKLEIWGGASGHMAVIILLTIVNCSILALVGLEHFTDLNWSGAALLGFAVSFSSTVCAIKILEERGELRARHGQVAIGILVIQDIAAVIFLTLATGKTPSWWALALFALPLLTPLISKLLQKSGHGELLPLAGFFLAFSGGEIFELVGLKAHLGALVVGALISGDSKAAELSKSLLDFKDLFLIGFFLSIGFTALPTVDMLGVALIMVIALPFKAILFFLWLTRLKLRSRTAFLTALSLANYSEFGLIVCSFSVEHELLEEKWLVIMALAVAISFIFSSIINIYAHGVFSRWANLLSYFERDQRLPEDHFNQPSGATVLVIGMGRVGTGAYDTLQSDSSHKVCGIDVDQARVDKHIEANRNVVTADAEDPDFWTHINLDDVKLIMLAMPNFQDILEAIKQLKRINYRGKTAGVVRYEDEKKELLDSGADVVFNFYQEVGVGFAEQSIHLLEDQ